MTEEQLAFFTSRKTFTTSEAHRLGISKKDLKSNPSLVCFGSFPIRHSTGVIRENIWTYDEELALLAQSAKRMKKTQQNQEQVHALIRRIETIVSAKLGFDNVPLPSDLASIVNTGIVKQEVQSGNINI